MYKTEEEMVEVEVKQKAGGLGVSHSLSVFKLYASFLRVFL